MTRQQAPSYLKFDKHSYPWKPEIDYRREPEKYRVGKGEQGVLICEPYKSELTRHWRFKTPEMASHSSAVLYNMFEEYLKAGDFVGGRDGAEIPADGISPRTEVCELQRRGQI
jgi:hypothetical protein